MNSELVDAFRGDALSSISIVALTFNLLIGAMFSFIISWHFRKYGSTLSNREELSQVFPFILLTTILIITIVKSSIALSLGLVGALSIVRFRTPIKEPEELAYLFLAIAVGIGLGASQTLPTIVSGSLILILLAAIRQTKINKESSAKGIYLSLDWDKKVGEVPENTLEELNEVILKFVKACDLRRYNIKSSKFEATYLITTSSVNDLDKLCSELRSNYPDIAISILDQNQFHGI